MEDDARLDFPATRRNTEAIEAVLKGVLPSTGLVLEIASGSGQHTAKFAASYPHLTWQPSDLDPRHRQSIGAWTRDIENVRPPLELDTTRSPWPIDEAAVIFCANMIHIAPWEAAVGLIAGAGRTLSTGGLLIIYGPFMIDGAHTAPSNAQFDMSLKTSDPSWGVRDLGDVCELARDAGLELQQTVEMPANNLTVFFRK